MDGLEVSCFVVLFLKYVKQRFTFNYKSKVKAQTFLRDYRRLF